MNSGTDSAMTYLVPSTSVMTVSGVQSARSTRSGFRANTAPLRRVTRITTSVLGLSWLVAGIRGRYLSFCPRAGAAEGRRFAIQVRLGQMAVGRGGASMPPPAGAGFVLLLTSASG